MSAGSADYRAFLESKVATAPTLGFALDEDEVSDRIAPHARAIVRWMVLGGRRACFAAFGLHKTVIQLEAVRLTLTKAGGRGLIVIPLGVRQEFRRDAVERLGWKEAPRFIRRIEEADAEGIYLTNYESVRDGKLDPKHFTVSSLDEGSVLRGFGGTKTFREFMRLFAGQDGPKGPISGGVPYRFVATATPSPNEYIELLAYAAYLDVMDVSAAKTRFFKRDSTKADHLTLHPHKEAEFWLWVSSWAIFLQRPSDLGPQFSDDGFDLPAADIRWHEVETDHRKAGSERDGQGRMFKNAALGVSQAAGEKRDSLPTRMAKLMELRAEDPGAHRIIWHDLEREREAIEAAIPGVVTVYGSQDLDLREQAVCDFADGKTVEIAGKPVMLGSGVNWQRHCAWEIFLGIGFKFQDLIQAIHRVLRYGQTKRVRIDLIYTEAEREVRRALEKKWAQHVEMVAKMSAIIKEHGLSNAGVIGALTRSMGVKRVEAKGDKWRLVNADAIEEARSIESDSVHLVVTSIPFSTQYEYTPSYNDLGHTDSDEHFFRHLGYLTPELLRVLQPGRVAAVHVKDRIVPGGLTGLGFQTVSPFSDYTVAHFKAHGFAFLGRKTVVTDVVRENNQTYRLGWTEQCKDGSRMGAGMPEYVLLFRKPPTDTSNGYADVPVVKAKKEWKSKVWHVPDCREDDSCECERFGRWLHEKGYSRARWQMDAHGFTRSDGNRPLSIRDLDGLAHDQIFKLFRKYSLTDTYDFENHVALAEGLEERGLLPSTFMLLQPGVLASGRLDRHRPDAERSTCCRSGRAPRCTCAPLQFDIVDRLIVQFSQEGETVFDPFAGLGTVPYCALKLKRRGLGIELNAGYFADAVAYCAAAERDADMPTLFDLSPVEAEREEIEA